MPAPCLFLDGWLGRHGWGGSCPRLAGKHRLHPIPLQHCAVHSIKSPPLLDRACLLPPPPTLASLTDGLGLHLLGTLKRPGWSERLVLSVLLALPTDREHAREPAATDTMHRWRCGLTSSAPLVPPRARSLSRNYVGPRLVVVLEGQDGLRPRVLVSVRRSRRAGHAGVTARTPGRCSTGAGGGDGDRWGRDPTVEEGIGIRQPGHGWMVWKWNQASVRRLPVSRHATRAVQPCGGHLSDDWPGRRPPDPGAWPVLAWDNFGISPPRPSDQTSVLKSKPSEL